MRCWRGSRGAIRRRRRRLRGTSRRVYRTGPSRCRATSRPSAASCCAAWRRTPRAGASWRSTCSPPMRSSPMRSRPRRTPTRRASPPSPAGSSGRYAPYDLSVGSPSGAAGPRGPEPHRGRSGGGRRPHRAGRGRCGGEAHRDAGGVPRRGERGRPSRHGRGDPGVPGGAGRTGPAAVRRRRHQVTRPGGRRAGCGGGLRRRRNGGRAGPAGRPGGVGARGARMTEGGAERVRAGLETLAALAARIAAEEAEAVAAIADRYEAVLRAGGTLFFAGNGGSAADAQHLATEYVVRYQSTRPALRAVALTTDTSLLTACANDLGFDEVFARQVEALARPGDLLSLHSTSGESPNVIRAAQAAKARGVPVVAFLGKGGGQVKDHADVTLIVPSDDTARIQELHLAIEHLICDLVEERLRG